MPYPVMFNLEINSQPTINNLDLNYNYEQYRTNPLYLSSENIVEEEDDLFLSNVNLQNFNNQSQTNRPNKKPRNSSTHLTPGALTQKSPKPHI